VTDPDRVAQFRADLLAAPAALDRLIDAWEAPDWPIGVLPERSGRRLVFSGLGSSRYAALVAGAELAALGRDASVEWASAPGPPDPAAVMFAISSSGRTPEVVAAARRHAAAGGPAIAVTNAVGSPLAAAATATLPLLAGVERGGIACTTFRATAIALVLATGAADGASVRRHVDALREALMAADPRVDAAVDLLERAETVDVIGDGRAIGALEQAALMLREGPRLRAAAWDAGDWLHTAVYTALPGHRAILFAGTPYDDELTDTIARRGGELVRVHEDGAAAPLVAAIVGLAVVERIAAGVWQRAAAVDRPS
jgi:fructoselysine-6-P-deglycase FrlB-like protein